MEEKGELYSINSKAFAFSLFSPIQTSSFV